jgi:hypothetical protein
MDLKDLKERLRLELERRSQSTHVQQHCPSGGNRFAPNKDTIVVRHIAYLGPMTDALAILIHVGDKEFFAPTRDGLTLTWSEVVDRFIAVNPHVSWSDIRHELERRTE